MQEISQPSFYYIAYSFAEEENSANQIQSKNTFEHLKKMNPCFRGIFLGNKKSLIWNARKQENKYFVDMVGYKIGTVEGFFKTGVLRKNLLPYFSLRIFKYF